MGKGSGDEGSCCYKPPGCAGTCVLVFGILGVIMSSIFTFMGLIFFMHIGFALLGAGILIGMAWGLILGTINNILQIAFNSLPICCCTSAKGYRMSAICNAVSVFLGFLCIIMIAADHGAVDSDVDDEDLEDAIHAWATLFYLFVFFPAFFSFAIAVSCWKGSSQFPSANTHAPVATGEVMTVEVAKT